MQGNVYVYLALALCILVMLGIVTALFLNSIGKRKGNDKE